MSRNDFVELLHEKDRISLSVNVRRHVMVVMGTTKVKANTVLPPAARLQQHTEERTMGWLLDST